MTDKQLNDDQLRLAIRAELQEFAEANKEVVKEAIREWLDAQWARVGRWTVHGMVATIGAGLFAGAMWLTQHVKIDAIR